MRTIDELVGVAVSLITAQQARIKEQTDRIAELENAPPPPVPPIPEDVVTDNNRIALEDAINAATTPIPAPDANPPQ